MGVCLAELQQAAEKRSACRAAQPRDAACPPSLVSNWGPGSAAGGTKPPTSCCQAVRSVSLLPGLPARDPGLPEEAHGLCLRTAGYLHRLHGSYVCSSVLALRGRFQQGRHVLN